MGTEFSRQREVRVGVLEYREVQESRVRVGLWVELYKSHLMTETKLTLLYTFVTVDTAQHLDWSYNHRNKPLGTRVREFPDLVSLWINQQRTM